jgi:hypothetical protein
MFLLSLLALLLPTVSFAQEQQVVDKEGRDVQTLYASVGPRLRFNSREALALGELRIQPQDCEVMDDTHFDCTEALRRELSRSAGYETVVLLKPLVLEATEDRSFPETTSCSLIELRSIIRRAVWENKNFEGLGFFADGSLSYIEKTQMLVQKDAFFLSNNEPAIVHSFLDVGLCQKPDFTAETYNFKAYAQFAGPGAGQSTRVWENKPTDYRLSLQPGQRGFDRTLDVIRP